MSSFYYVIQDDARLLFVDDDPILRAFAEVNLASPSTAIVCVADGQAALDEIARQPFDAVLLDLEMPGVDGFEVLRRLRADPRTAALPVIVQTGREDTAAIDQAYELGATSFVTKPLNWRLLTYQIRYVLRASRDEARRAPVAA